MALWSCCCDDSHVLSSEKATMFSWAFFASSGLQRACMHNMRLSVSCVHHACNCRPGICAWHRSRLRSSDASFSCSFANHERHDVCRDGPTNQTIPQPLLGNGHQVPLMYRELFQKMATTIDFQFAIQEWLGNNLGSVSISIAMLGTEKVCRFAIRQMPNL